MNVDPFPDVEDFNEAMRRAVTACNGFVYHGSDFEAQIRFVKYLRSNPEEAALLLANYT